jgi:hypothetical protein
LSETLKGSGVDTVFGSENKARDIHWSAPAEPLNR